VLFAKGFGKPIQTKILVKKPGIFAPPHFKKHRRINILSVLLFSVRGPVFVSHKSLIPTQFSARFEGAANG
jgi:hypothetical protein